MKRDMDLVRDILLYSEELNQGGNVIRMNYAHFPKYTPDQIYGHTRMLREQGLLRDCTQTISGPPSLVGLTWSGHDFLDAVRDETVWEKTKNAATEGGGFTIDILKQLAVGFLKTQIKERTGVEIG